MDQNVLGPQRTLRITKFVKFFALPLIILSFSATQAVILWSIYGLHGYFLLFMATILGLFITSMTILFIVNSLVYVYQMLFYYKPKSPLLKLIHLFHTSLIFKKNFIWSIAILFLFCCFATTFSINKALIPTLNYFSWDNIFHRIDFYVFQGTTPASLLLNSYFSPLLLIFFEILYQIWYVVYIYCFAFVAFYLYDKDLGRIFLLSSFLCWYVGGNLIALLFSSAGPIFVEIHNIGDYVHLTPLLEGLSIIDFSFAHNIKEKLLVSLNNSGFSSISAFPSMHVASSMLASFLFLGHKRVPLYLSLCFPMFIFIGSIILLWHYWIDSIFAVLFAVICWSASSYAYSRKLWF